MELVTVPWLVLALLVLVGAGLAKLSDFLHIAIIACYEKIAD